MATTQDIQELDRIIGERLRIIDMLAIVGTGDFTAAVVVVSGAGKTFIDTPTGQPVVFNVSQNAATTALNNRKTAIETRLTALGITFT